MAAYVGDGCVVVVAMLCFDAQIDLTPLIVAAVGGNVDALAMLPDRGTDLEAKESVSPLDRGSQLWP